MELKDLLNNPASAAFSRIKYLQKYGADEEVARFLNHLFLKAVEAKYRGDWDEFTRFLEEWEDKALQYQFKTVAIPSVGPIPWATLSKPLSQCKFALVTTGGVYVEGQKPFEPRDDTTYRQIPKDLDKSQIRILHRGYDNGPALQDINCIFPLDIFKDMESEGVIKELAQINYSFMGMIYDTDTLSNVTAAEVARKLKEDGVDAVFLAST